MVIEKLLADLAVISKLSDYPGSQDGLSTDEFKAKFDEAALAIQDYINNVLVPNIEAVSPGEAEGMFLRLAGGTMNGPINMNSKRLTNLPLPSADNDATPRKYVLPRAGGTMTGAINMGGHKVTNLATPTGDLDAVSKSYVDSTRFLTEVTLRASGWSANAPHTQRVDLAGINSADTPHYGVVYSGVLQNDIVLKNEFAKVDDLDTYNGYMVFTCFEEKPSVDMTVQIEAQRLGSSATNEAAMLRLRQGLDSEVQADIEETEYGAENATLNSEPTATTFDFTVL